MNGLPNITGQAQVLDALRALLQNDKLPHAFLFYGPQGVGKRLCAELMARRLICGGNDAFDPLIYRTDVPEYAQIEAYSSPDYHVLTPPEDKKIIKVDSVRQMMQKITLSTDNRRVIIIDAAEQMNTSATNALLKTLEEPLPDTHLILISHRISRLLPTVVSRCRQFRFVPLAPEHLHSLMAQHGIPADKQEVLARLAEGSIGRALHYFNNIKVLEPLLPLWQGQLPDAAAQLDIAAQLNKRDDADCALDVLGAWLHAYAAGQQPLLATDAYTRLHHLRREMNTYNLPGTAVMDEAFAAMQKIFDAARPSA